MHFKSERYLQWSRWYDLLSLAGHSELRLRLGRPHPQGKRNADTIVNSFIYEIFFLNLSCCYPSARTSSTQHQEASQTIDQRPQLDQIRRHPRQNDSRKLSRAMSKYTLLGHGTSHVFSLSKKSSRVVIYRDTVSSIGLARGKRLLPGTTEGMTHVCYFRHALALDERRVKFQPEYAWGGSTLPRCGAAGCTG